jgi:hypothetical protein
MITKNKRLLGILLIVGTLLLIPLVAMQFSSEVNWKLADFAIAAVLLFGTGLVIDLVIRKVANSEKRIALIIGVVIILLLIWAELAVGIFGTPFAGN